MTLHCLIGNLKSDHVIYLPSSGSTLNEHQIARLALEDAFFLDQGLFKSSCIPWVEAIGDRESCKGQCHFVQRTAVSSPEAPSGISVREFFEEQL